MGKRLTGFDYSRPLFYMVTIKCCAGRQALSEIVAPGKCQLNAITRAMVNCIRHFHEGCKVIAPIECFSIMPDHIHLLIRIVDRIKTLRGAGDCGGQGAMSLALMRLEAIVSLLMQALEGRYSEVTGLREEIFEASWHDWIVMAEARASRIGPGGAGAGTFMSPCEKECGNAIYSAGGSLIVLSPEGFSAQSHPPRSKEALCAKGRMLFLSLWEPTAAKPDNATLYKRCHEMGDMLLGAKRLGKSKTLRVGESDSGSSSGGGDLGGDGLGGGSPAAMPPAAGAPSKSLALTHPMTRKEPSP